MDIVLSLQMLPFAAEGACSDSRVSCDSDVSCKSETSCVSLESQGKPREELM